MIKLNLKIKDQFEFDLLHTYLMFNAPRNIAPALQKATSQKELEEAIKHVRENAQYSDDYSRTREEERALDTIINELNHLNFANESTILNSAHQKLLKKSFEKADWSRFIELGLDVPGLFVTITPPKVNLRSSLSPLNGQSMAPFTVELSELDDKIYALEMSDNGEAKEDFSNLFNFTARRAIIEIIAPQLTDYVLSQKYIASNIEDLNKEVENVLTTYLQTLNKPKHPIWRDLIARYDTLLDSTIENTKINVRFMKNIEPLINSHRVEFIRGNLGDTVAMKTPKEFRDLIVIGEHIEESKVDQQEFIQFLKILRRKDPNAFRQATQRYSNDLLKIQKYLYDGWIERGKTFASTLRETDDLNSKLNEFLADYQHNFGSNMLSRVHRKAIRDIMDNE